MQKFSNLNSTKTLKRLILIVVVVIGVMLIGFAGYYYWDRYVYIGDMSTLERDIANLEQEVRKNPENVNLRMVLAQYYLEHGNNLAAVEQANQITNVFPDNDGALIIAGMAYTNLGQAQQALVPLSKFIDMHEGGEMAHVDTMLQAALYLSGKNYISLEDYANAEKVLLRALAINRTDADSMYQLGLTYAQMNKHDLAIEQLENAVRFVPNFMEAYLQMAESYSELGQIHLAVYARGMVAYSMNDFSKALELLEESSIHLDDFYPVHLGLAMTLEGMGESVLAREHYHRVLELDPENFIAFQALSRMQQDSGN